MSEALPPAKRAWEYLKNAKVTMAGYLSMAAINLYFGDSLVVHSEESFNEQMEKALPSACSSPDVTGNSHIDFGLVTTGLVVTTELTRQTSTMPEIAGTALTGQLVASGVDAVADKTDLIHGASDAGSSGMWTALGAKWLGDRIVSAESDKTRRLWQLGATAFGGAMLFGGFVIVGGDDAKLDMLSHGGALGVGVAAHKIGSWRKQHKNGELIEFPTTSVDIAADLAA